MLVEPLAPNGPDSSFESLLRSQHADGLVISGPRVDDPSLLALAGDDFPIVIQGTMPGLSVASVDVDNVAGARGAVDHLLALGHRRVLNPGLQRAQVCGIGESTAATGGSPASPMPRWCTPRRRIG